MIESKQTETPAGHAMLAGISGIDASGKGFVTKRIDDELRSKGLRTALIRADDWLELPHIRYGKREPGLHFYEHALRLDEMFERLILPLKKDRSVRLSAELLTETAEKCHKHTYSFHDIDIILVEGIFLFKPRYSPSFDLRIWVDCSFETAMDRAVRRSQEGLDEASTKRAYETIYFPAQLIHLDRDHPVKAADIIINNH